MITSARSRVLARLHPRAIAITVFAASLFAGSPARAQSPPAFAGAYLGFEGGLEHFIGGALVDDVDTLQQDTKGVVSVFGGLRGQFGGVVIGGELGVGATGGDLSLIDSSRGLRVDYANSSQWFWRLQAGHAFGPGTLAFAYLSEVTRRFDVTITRGGATEAQRDEQGMLRFGGGIEQRLAGRLRARVLVGTGRADFGDRPLNIDAGRRLEVTGGLVIRF